VGDDGDADGREHDEAEREQPDRPNAGSQVTERGEERSAVQERRQDAEEDQLRRKLDGRHPRQEADREAAEHEQDRVRDAQGRREREHRRNGDEQPQRDDSVLEVEVHRPILPKPGPAT
jgi:hypothetical protein